MQLSHTRLIRGLCWIVSQFKQVLSKAKLSFRCRIMQKNKQTKNFTAAVNVVVVQCMSCTSKWTSAGPTMCCSRPSVLTTIKARWLWWELMAYLKKARTQSWCLSCFELNFACSCFKCEPTPWSKAPARAVALRSVMYQWRSKDQASATERFGALMAAVYRLLYCPAAFHFYRVRPLTAWLFSLFVCFIMLVSCCE